MMVTLPHPTRRGTFTTETDDPRLIAMAEEFVTLGRREHARAVAQVGLHRLLYGFHVHDLEELADRLDAIANGLRRAKRSMLADSRSLEVAA